MLKASSVKFFIWKINSIPDKEYSVGSRTRQSPELVALKAKDTPTVQEPVVQQNKSGKVDLTQGWESSAPKPRGGEKEDSHSANRNWKQKGLLTYMSHVKPVPT